MLDGAADNAGIPDFVCQGKIFTEQRVNCGETYEVDNAALQRPEFAGSDQIPAVILRFLQLDVKHIKLMSVHGLSANATVYFIESFFVYQVVGDAVAAAGQSGVPPVTIKSDITTIDVTFLIVPHKPGIIAPLSVGTHELDLDNSVVAIYVPVGGVLFVLLAVAIFAKLFRVTGEYSVSIGVYVLGNRFSGIVIES